MKRSTTVFILLLASLLIGACNHTAPFPAVAKGPVILISIDGFRWDYLQKYEAPTLKRLAAAGVHATRMTPSFPSKTFPNHYTLVTGLYPQNHGIVANWFWDPAFGEMFNMSKLEEKWWSGGEPIWITAEKQGVRSACFFWPGSETPHGSVRATRSMPFNKKLTATQRVDGLLGWLDVPPAERPRFLTLYFDHVDDAGHIFGPDAPETRAAVGEADEAIARLLAGLTARGMREQTSFVIVSDHGMSECSPDRVIFFEDLMDTNTVQVESNGPNGGVRPKPGTMTPAELVASIRAKAPPQLQVYLREDVPARLHYNRGERIPPVVLMADDGWNIESKIGWPRRAATYIRATHGWDPATSNMGALFIATGPAFQRGVEIPDVANIHVYNLLCAALGITPAANDGDDRLVRAALRK